MKEQFKQVWRKANSLKNIVFVILAFFIGIALNLSQYAIIVLVFGVAFTTTWWFSRPHFKNASSQLILKTLRKYPAVIIKNSPHLVAFGSRDPILAAAYRSPVPRFMLKKQITQMKVENIDFSITDLKMRTYLIFKIKLDIYTPINKKLKHFKQLIEALELSFNVSFGPVERHEVVHLFGLESHLKGSGPTSDFSEVKDDETGSTFKSSHKTAPSIPKPVKISFNRPKTPTTIPTIPKPTKKFNEPILGLGLVAGGDQQAVFNGKLSMTQCVKIHYGLKSKLTNIHDLDFENERLPPQILEKGSEYSYMVFGVNKFPTRVWIYVNQNTVPKLIEEFSRIKRLFSALNNNDSEVYQDRLREIMNILTNRFQVTSTKLDIPKINNTSKLIVKN